MADAGRVSMCQLRIMCIALLEFICLKAQPRSRLLISFLQQTLDGKIVFITAQTIIFSGYLWFCETSTLHEL